MARQIIILERQPAGWPGTNMVHAVFWIPVPAGQEAPAPGIRSAVLGPDAPDATELAALQAGTVKEYVVRYHFPDNYSAANTRTFLEACYARAVAGFVPPGASYGAKWDGTTWTA